MYRSWGKFLKELVQEIFVVLFCILLSTTSQLSLGLDSKIKLSNNLLIDQIRLHGYKLFKSLPHIGRIFIELFDTKVLNAINPRV